MTGVNFPHLSNIFGFSGLRLSQVEFHCDICERNYQIRESWASLRSIVPPHSPKAPGTHLPQDVEFRQILSRKSLLLAHRPVLPQVQQGVNVGSKLFHQ
jgi:hypothetical protein